MRIATIKSSALCIFILITIAHGRHASAAGVVTSHDLASKTAIQILKSGGTAADAIIAASFTLNVVQPYKMGIGGGGLIVTSKNGKTLALDSREMAPASVTDTLLLDASGNPLPRKVAITGPLPVGVPGTLAGLYALHRKYGKLPWRKLLEPAIAHAKNGFPITQIFANELEENWDRLSKFEASKKIYSNSDGGFLTRGLTLRQPDLARTLETIARDGAGSFYTGKLADSWIDAANSIGVKMTKSDLKNYKVRESNPVHYKLFGFDAYTAPPPSTGGILLAGAIRFLDSYYKTRKVPAADSAERVIVTAEALRFYQQMRDDQVADPPFGKVNPQTYLGSDEEKSNWEKIRQQISEKLAKLPAQPANNSATEFRPQEKDTSHTAHLSVTDDHGLTVAYTTTIEALFGSAMTVPGHGFLLNNELSDFDSVPGKANSPAAFKRPRSNMSPTILTDKGVAVASLGCAGGLRIPTTLTLILENYYIQKLSGAEAMAFPRFHLKKDKLEMEKGFPEATLNALKTAGYDIEPISTMWSVPEALLRRNSKAKWEAVAEPRYDGLGITF